jgi:hypothetical protein
MGREARFAVAPVVGEDLDLLADLSGCPVRDVLLAFGFEAKSFSTELDFGDFISFQMPCRTKGVR